MSVPRVARIHLVYQFIILTLLIFAISYNEILPDKRFLFLALIPVFCYQLFIVFCCTELLPLPTWFSRTETEVATDQEQTSDDTGSSDIISREGSKSPIESNAISPVIPRARLSKKNKTPDSVTSSDANTQTVRPSVSDVFIKKGPVFTKASARRSESTKSYCFTHRENRCDDRLGTKENVPSYKTRNWRSLQDQKGTKSQSNLKSPSLSIEESKEAIATSPVKLETLEESIESDLTRSYSFPFRHRKQSSYMESDSTLANDLNIPVMPAWNAIDSFSPSTTYRRRKSISTEAIDRELRLINSHFELNAKNDFTQSMEVARESIEPAVAKRGLKSSASFNKWKQGIASYFNKSKRENIKADDGDNKKQYFRELFVEKDILHQGPGKKPVKRSNSSFKSDSRVKLSNRSPSYISYETDYFGDELPSFS